MYYGVMMVKMGDADGLVSGARSTPRAICCARRFKSSKSKPGIKTVSSAFLMECPNKPTAIRRNGLFRLRGQYRAGQRNSLPASRWARRTTDRSLAGIRAAHCHAFVLHKGQRQARFGHQSAGSDPPCKEMAPDLHAGRRTAA